MFDISDKNMKILKILKENSRLSTGKISKKINVPATTVFNRIKKMEKEGIIKKYTIDIDYKKIGINILAFVFVSQDYKLIGENKKDILFEEISRDPHIIGVFRVTGRYDLLLVVRTKDVEELNSFLVGIQKSSYGIIKTETMVVLKQASN